MKPKIQKKTKVLKSFLSSNLNVPLTFAPYRDAKSLPE